MARTEIRVTPEAKLRWFDEIGYRPHKAEGEPLDGKRFWEGEGQYEVHCSKFRDIVVCAGARFGKSMLGAREMECDLLLPQRRWWVVGPTYPLAGKEWRYAVDDFLRGLGKRQILSLHDNPAGGDMYLRLGNGSELEGKSAAKPAGLLGEELDGVILAEASQIDSDIINRYVLPRLINRKGRIIVPTTPAGMKGPEDWLYEMFHKGKNPELTGVKSWEFPTESNPYIDRDELRRIKETVGDEIWNEQFLGKFVYRVGRFYKEFGPIHIAEEGIVYNPLLPVNRGWDFSYHTPAVIWTQVDTRDRHLVLGEFLPRDVPFPDFVQVVQFISGRVKARELSEYQRRLVDKERLMPHFTGREKFHDFCDPAGSHTYTAPTAKGEMSDVQIMKNAGIFPKFRVSENIERTNIVRAELQARVKENDKPMFLVDRRRCPVLIAGFEGGLRIDEKNPDHYLKGPSGGDYDHPFDALGYIELHLRKTMLYYNVDYGWEQYIHPQYRKPGGERSGHTYLGGGIARFHS